MKACAYLNYITQCNVQGALNWDNVARLSPIVLPVNVKFMYNMSTKFKIHAKVMTSPLNVKFVP